MKDLRRLAAAYGVLVDYHGVDGRSLARPEALLAVLSLLGAPVRRPGDVSEALRARAGELRRKLLPEAVIAWDGQLLELPVRARAALDCGELLVALEDGRLVEGTFGRGGRQVAFAEPLPYGYHRLTLRANGIETTAPLVAAPRRSFRFDDHRRRWGLFAPTYGLWSRQGNGGSGDFSELGRLVELTEDHGGGFVATLPLLATFVDDPSPYSPVSRLFWNELYVDLRSTPEWSEWDDGSLPTNTNELIDYRALDSQRRPILMRMAHRARARRPERILEYSARRPDLVSYARFRAEKEDGRERKPGSPRDLDDERILYHLYGQMVADEQLGALQNRARAKDTRLYFDLPLGVHRSGFDVVSRVSQFALGADVGAPPDAVFPDGQNWGFPPMLPHRIRDEGFAYLRRTLEASMRHSDILRVDHVMGLHRQFWIPHGFEKRDGVYVRYPTEELYAVFNLESHRNRCELVGENLGIVPRAVNEALDRNGWRGIYVLQFSLTGVREEPLAPIPGPAVASFNTHDTPTFRGFRRARDVREREESGIIDASRADELARDRAAAIVALDARLGDDSGNEETRLLAWLALLLESDADLVAVTLEDLWLEETPQNVPGRVDLPNWRRRLRYPLDGLPEEVVSRLDVIGRRSRNKK